MQVEFYLLKNFEKASNMNMELLSALLYCTCLKAISQNTTLKKMSYEEYFRKREKTRKKYSPMTSRPKICMTIKFGLEAIKSSVVAPEPRKYIFATDRIEECVQKVNHLTISTKRFFQRKETTKLLDVG